MQFDRPLPGQSLTQEPKSAPYERPPEVVDPVVALDGHLRSLSRPEAIEEIVFFLDVMEVPIVTLTEGVLRAAVLDGKHSVDVSLIIAHVVHEFIRGVAEAAGIEYDEGIIDEEGEAAKTYERNILRAKKHMRRKGISTESIDKTEQMLASSVDEEQPVEDNTEQEVASAEQAEMDAEKGLMARG